MHPELDAALCARHPKIFAERHGDPSTTAMCWGLEVGDGWFELIDALCGQLQAETDENEAPQIVAGQVKSKAGSLRFHVSEASERQRAMIDLAHAVSRHVCQTCGSMGRANAGAEAGVAPGCPTCRAGGALGRSGP